MGIPFDANSTRRWPLSWVPDPHTIVRIDLPTWRFPSSSKSLCLRMSSVFSPYTSNPESFFTSEFWFSPCTLAVKKLSRMYTWPQCCWNSPCLSCLQQYFTKISFLSLKSPCPHQKKSDYEWLSLSEREHKLKWPWHFFKIYDFPL